MHRTELLALVVSCGLVFFSGPALAQTRGYNLGWIDGKYGRDLSSAYDSADWRRVFDRTRASGGSAVRVWLFEGAKKEGLVYSGRGGVRIDPVFLRNVREVVQLARARHIRIYWTGLSGNWGRRWARGTADSQRHYNLLNNKYGLADSFRRDVLGPLLDVITAVPEAVWAFDIMNEVQGSVREWFWSDGWAGARRFLRATVAFMRSRAPGLPVTASSGHHTAISDVLAGRFDGLGFQFLDVHLYSDTPGIEGGWALSQHARSRGMAVVLGEYGQKSSAPDTWLQARVVYGALYDARRFGFAGTFAWRIEDDQASGYQYSFYDGEQQRFAAYVMRRF